MHFCISRCDPRGALPKFHVWLGSASCNHIRALSSRGGKPAALAQSCGRRAKGLETICPGCLLSWSPAMPMTELLPNTGNRARRDSLRKPLRLKAWSSVHPTGLSGMGAMDTSGVERSRRLRDDLLDLASRCEATGLQMDFAFSTMPNTLVPDSGYNVRLRPARFQSLRICCYRSALGQLLRHRQARRGRLNTGSALGTARHASLNRTGRRCCPWKRNRCFEYLMPADFFLPGQRG